MNEKVIMKDSDEAASLTTVTGWASRHGRFFGNGPNAEDCARYDGCTHVACDACGEPAKRGYCLCRSCSKLKKAERYAAMPRKPWDGKALLYSVTKDKFFKGPEYAEDDLEEGETLDDLRLVICEPVYGQSLDSSYFCDELPDDDDDLPSCLEEAIGAFNEALAKAPPLSWQPGKFALQLEG
jgi:hypothetical protein